MIIMTTKEKLDMLWKFLALFLVAFLSYRILDKGVVKIRTDINDYTQSGFSEMDVRLEKQNVGSEILTTLTVNGETVSDFEEKDGVIQWSSESGEVVKIEIPEAAHNDGGNRRIIKIIKD